MDRIAQRVLCKYGSTVNVTENGKTVKTKALIQPLHRKSYRYFSGRTLPQGRFDNSHYIMLAPPSLTLNKSSGAIIECHGVRYIAKASGGYEISGKKIYVWAVITACTAAAEDDYDSD